MLKGVIKQLIRESITEILNEMQVEIDNFDRVAKILQYRDPADEYYFVQITKRRKDNPHDDKRQGNYNGISWFLDSWKIHSVDELMALKPKIIDICNKNNARAYITINTRSEKQTAERVKLGFSPG